MEETTAELYEQICHPLLLDLVLETVFKHLSTRETLASCRLVSHQWCALCDPYFKKKNSTLIVTLSNEDSLLSFMSTFVQSHSPPWTNFQLNNFFELTLMNRQLFFNICSHSIKSLRLSAGNTVDLVQLFSMLKYLPNLEALEFEGLRSLITNQLSQSVSRYLNYDLARNRVSEFLAWESQLKETEIVQFEKLHHLKIVVQIEADTNETSFLFFKQLFFLIPHLTSFLCSCLDITAENTTIPGLIQALADNPKILAQLKTLRIDDLNNDGIESLIQFKTVNQLKLTKLILMVPMQNVQSSAIENLLKSQAETLEELSLGGHYSRMGADLEIKRLTWPFCMPRLKKLNFMGGLSIASNFEYINPVPWHHLQYSQQLPCIETLGFFYLTNYAMDSVWFNNCPQSLTQFPCLTLRKIIFSGGVEPIQSCKIQLLGQAFPLVQEFIVTIDNHESLSLVFQTWPKLQVLCLGLTTMIQNLDSHFTGIQLDKTEEDQVNMDKFESLEYLDFAENSSRKIDNILLLQDLRQFELCLEFLPLFHLNNDTSLLSDITAMTALRHLKNLNHLIINRSAMTKNALKILNQDLTLEKCHVGDQFGNLINFHSISTNTPDRDSPECESIYYESNS